MCSNYGNWLYSAGIGNDPREDRKFNVVKQGFDYDSEVQGLQLVAFQFYSNAHIHICLEYFRYYFKYIFYVPGSIIQLNLIIFNISI